MLKGMRRPGGLCLRIRCQHVRLGGVSSGSDRCRLGAHLTRVAPGVQAHCVGVFVPNKGADDTVVAYSLSAAGALAPL